jgi:predicted MPP superfamily phosphohydrolase
MFKKLFFLLITLSFIGFNSYRIKVDRIQKPINSNVLKDSIINLKGNNPIALVGDLQRTTIWELMIGREQNDSERKKIIENIALENPAALILLGDMVANGADVKEWDYLHNLLKPIVNENIPIIPVLGNHEYWGDNNCTS